MFTSYTIAGGSLHTAVRHRNGNCQEASSGAFVSLMSDVFISLSGVFTSPFGVFISLTDVYTPLPDVYVALSDVSLMRRA